MTRLNFIVGPSVKADRQSPALKRVNQNPLLGRNWEKMIRMSDVRARIIDEDKHIVYFIFEGL